MNECVLTLIAPMEMEDLLADWLLNYHPEVVFTSQPVSCHGMAHEHLNTAEQVTGRQERLLIQVQVPVATAEDIRDRLSAEFHQARLRYWIAPVREAGLLGE